MKKTLVAGMMTLFTIALGCGAEEGGPTAALAVTTHSPTEVSGTFVDGTTTLRFAVAEAGPNLVDLRFDLGGLQFTSSIDFGRGVGEIGSSQQRLFTAADADHMVALYQALAEAIPEDEGAQTLVENALLRQISLIAVAPRDELIPHFTFASERSWVYLSCACYVQYIGSGYYRYAGRYCNGGCPGRCGVGCGTDGHGAYTQDCAKHDYGLGSWFAASDDYSFAAWNC